MIIFPLLRFTLLPFFIREVVQRKRVTIILFHDVDANKFDLYLRALKSRYNIISLKDFIEKKYAGKINELPPKSLIVTFDDGHKDNYKLTPIIKKYDVPITFFLCSGIVSTKRHFWFTHNTNVANIRESLKKKSNEEKLNVLRQFGFDEEKEFDDRQALSKAEIEDMKCVADFQSHTRYHSILPKCSTRKAYEEIEQSKRELEDNYKLTIYALSYPNGDYSNRDISIAKNEGYLCGITVDPGFNTQNTDVFKLKRITAGDDAGINELLVKTSGLWSYMKNMIKTQSHGYVSIEENGQKKKSDENKCFM